MKHMIMVLAATFAVSAYATDAHKPAAPAHAPKAPAHPEAMKPTATAPTTTHGDDVCKTAKDQKKCMEEQAKKKAM